MKASVKHTAQAVNRSVQVIVKLYSIRHSIRPWKWISTDFTLVRMHPLHPTPTPPPPNPHTLCLCISLFVTNV